MLTRACNLKCSYCGEDAAFELPPIDLAYPLETLKAFFEQDESDITVQFYGGEPLLRISLLEEIMDTLPMVKKWSVQTNAINLHKMKPSYLTQISTILASIDGRQAITDKNRGKGVYQRVLTNCKKARKKGFTGDLIARMTVSELSDVYKEVTHLATLDEVAFDHIHWQLDSQWDDDPNARWTDFSGWVKHSYNPGITKLVRWWVKSLEKGEMIGIVPFIPLLKSLLYNIPSKLRCGAGIDSFAINPDGTISVCPISPEFEFSIVGDIFSNTPHELPNKVPLKEPCPSCDIYDICGGRCLFINHTKLWGLDGFNKVCSTVKHLISELRSVTPRVKELLQKGVIDSSAFNYPAFNNGCEIIP